MLKPRLFLNRLSGSHPSRWALLLCASVSLALASACGASGSDEDEISVQLDWTPNTNHIGIYVALANGWYEEAGIKVDVLPYTDINPDTVVANGKADVGISFPPNLIFSRAAGLDLISIAAVLQRNVTELAVLDSSEIKRPRDFDGKVYAGFGLPFEEPHIKTVVKADGGKGEFTTATLSTAAYEALYAKRADFSEIYVAWEGIEAELRGIKLRTFRYDDFGVPDFPGVVLVADKKNVEKKEDALRKFIAATKRGYEYAAQNPEQAAKIFSDYVGAETFPEPDMVRLSSIKLGPSMLTSSGSWGMQDAKAWNDYTNWLIGQGVVVDSNDKPISGELRGGPLFTNQLFEAPSGLSNLP
jgi:ABC-type nitrate/sulfonate/bicarbonate transport system substrate-binding protein